MSFRREEDDEVPEVEEDPLADEEAEEDAELSVPVDRHPRPVSLVGFSFGAAVISSIFGLLNLTMSPCLRTSSSLLPS